jgi:hypothetical protein
VDAEKDLQVRELYDTENNNEKDCINCPITSPFGIVKALPNDTFVMQQDSFIVWTRQIRDLESECKIKN